MEEVWKDIKEYKGLYQVSNFGRVRSVDRYVTQQGRGKEFTGLRKGRIIKPRLQNSGYLLVWLSMQGTVRAHTVHRLVGTAFISNPDGLSDINHKDGNKKNNNVLNLEWCTRNENIRHAYRNLGRKKSGKKIKCVELNVVFDSAADASRKTGINAGSIRHVACGIAKTAGGYRWEHV